MLVLCIHSRGGWYYEMTMWWLTRCHYITENAGRFDVVASSSSRDFSISSPPLDSTVNPVCTIVECQNSQYTQYFEHIIAILAPFWLVPLKIRLRSTLWADQHSDPEETNTAVQDRQRRYLLAVSIIYLISHRILCHLVIFWSNWCYQWIIQSSLFGRESAEPRSPRQERNLFLVSVYSRYQRVVGWPREVRVKYRYIQPPLI